MDKEEKRLKYLDQEKYDYIQNYLEQAREQTKDVDTHSVTTDTSDSGMPGSENAPSEVGTEDISGKLELWKPMLNNRIVYSYFERGCRKKCASDNPER